MVLQMKVSPMEQIKDADKIKMVTPVEWEATHIESHIKLNAAVEQFYSLFNGLIQWIHWILDKQEEAEEVYSASFSKLNDSIEELGNQIKWLVSSIEEINKKLKEWWKHLSRRYEWILDTDKEIDVELDAIQDLWKDYLVNVVINSVKANQWTKEYKFPQTSVAKGEYKPIISLVAKEWEHAVLEYDFTLILTEI